MLLYGDMDEIGSSCVSTFFCGDVEEIRLGFIFADVEASNSLCIVD